NKLGDRDSLRQRDRAPTLDVEKTAYGYSYVSIRNAGADGSYVRIYHYVMPAQQMRGSVTAWTGRNEIPSIHGHLWMPIDDEHSWVFNFLYSYDPSIPITAEVGEYSEAFYGRGAEDL